MFVSGHILVLHFDLSAMALFKILALHVGQAAALPTCCNLHCCDDVDMLNCDVLLSLNEPSFLMQTMR